MLFNATIERNYRMQFTTIANCEICNGYCLCRKYCGVMLCSDCNSLVSTKKGSGEERIEEARKEWQLKQNGIYTSIIG